MARGRSNAEIAAELVVSLTTVKRHVGNVLGKLGVSSRTRALVRAQRLSLV
jgi:ATP/maltotriose-dependent transcriptional regulator MalT